MVSPATVSETAALLPFPKECPRCGAPWAAETMVNDAIPVERMTQLATPRTLYECGSAFHPDNHKEFEVPSQEIQHPECVRRELIKHRGG